VSEPECPHHHPDFARPFGGDRFGRYAERFARFFGTPRFILGQTVVVAIWIVLNVHALHLGFAWDVYPFILLNLSFSLQAAYAAPLILLAQTRQAERDGLVAREQEHHREEVADRQVLAGERLNRLLAENTRLTEQVRALTTALCAHVGAEPPASAR
jgi:uncharacterized membrane protein